MGCKCFLQKVITMDFNCLKRRLFPERDGVLLIFLRQFLIRNLLFSWSMINYNLKENPLTLNELTAINTIFT